MVDEFGYFFETIKESEEKAKEEVNDEKNQIDLAQKFGLRISHLDKHMGNLYGFYGRTFLPLVIKYCEKYRITFRIQRFLEEELPMYLRNIHKEMISFSDSFNIPIIDRLISYSYEDKSDESYDSFKESMVHILRDLKKGLSEIYIHPSIESEEIKTISPY